MYSNIENSKYSFINLSFWLVQAVIYIFRFVFYSYKFTFKFSKKKMEPQIKLSTNLPTFVHTIMKPLFDLNSSQHRHDVWRSEKGL